MASYDEKLCQAMEIIAENAVKKAGYDKTIQATIVSCEDKTVGCYKVQYQDSQFYAYAADSKVTYTKGSLVYILVPNGNFSNNKAILGSVKKLGSNYIQVSEEKDQYEFIGGNIVEGNTESIKLSSYYSEQKTLYSTIDEINLIGFNGTSAMEYLKQASHLALGLTVQTSLKENQRFLGSYGIIVEAMYQTVDGDKILKTYRFDNSDMSGNPYKYFSPSSQIGFYAIDGAKLIEITKIMAFSEGFPEKKNFEELQPADYDITFNNIQLYGANLIEKDENGYSLNIKCEQGLYFNKSKTQAKELVAEPRINGAAVNESLHTVKYYWFMRDDAVGLSSLDYNLYGGKGWRCLNSYEGEREYLPSGNTYTLEKEAATALVTDLKVVAVFENHSISRVFSITNYLSEYIVILASERGTDFYQDQGEPILTAHCYKGNEEFSDAGLSYYWTKVEKDGIINNIEDETNTLQVYVRDIDEYATYSCSIYLNGTLIGADSIKITNGTMPEGSYSLSIEGAAAFKYDENGISPSAASQRSPQNIAPLTFVLRDNANGKNIDLEDILKADGIVWKVPVENTLLKFEGEGWKEENGYRYYKNVTFLTYSLETRYDYSKNNNRVELEVYYQGFNLKDSIDFWIRKEGENGTNGTAVSCRIVPDAIEGAEIPDWVIIYWKDDYIYSNFISSAGYYSPKFKTELYQEGELISEDEYTVEWSFLQNNYGGGVHESHWYEVSSDGRITRVSDEEIEAAAAQMNYPCNILQAKIKYDNNIYYTTLPIVTAVLSNDITIGIKDYTGFKEVQYASDGTNPKYNNAEPFTFVVKDSNDNEISFNDDIHYSYGLFGSRYINKSWEADSYLSNSFKGLVKNQIKVKPSNIYNGELLNSGFTVMVRKGENIDTDIILYIPIHFYLNRFGFSNLNDWNGNSIQIDEDGGYLLSPQMGAGTKDSNNRFTGLLMGEAKEANSTKSKIGLIGYASGEQSFFLDSETGSATFGKAGAGQIQIDPSTGAALLKSGNYSESNKSGMCIDLTTPSINFGSGNFAVDSNGLLTAVNGKFSGEINATSGTFSGTINALQGTFGKGSTKIEIGTDINNIYGNIHSGSHTTLNSTERGFYLAHDGLSLGSNFKLTSDGILNATGAKLTGEINATSGIFSGDINLTGKIENEKWVLDTNGLMHQQSESNSKQAGIQFNSSGDINVVGELYCNEKKGLTTSIQVCTSVSLNWWTTIVLSWYTLSKTYYTLNFTNGILTSTEQTYQGDDNPSGGSADS